MVQRREGGRYGETEISLAATCPPLLYLSSKHPASVGISVVPPSTQVTVFFSTLDLLPVCVAVFTQVLQTCLIDV